MRAEDVIPEMIWTLRQVNKREAARYQARFNRLEQTDDGDFTDRADKQAGYLWEDLDDALNARCPAYTYFGSHPGDRADYGIWPCLEQTSEDARFGEIGSGSDYPEGAPSTPEPYFLVVNDHGNCTLQRWNGRYWVTKWACA